MGDARLDSAPTRLAYGPHRGVPLPPPRLTRPRPDFLPRPLRFAAHQPLGRPPVLRGGRRSCGP